MAQNEKEQKYQRDLIVEHSKQAHQKVVSQHAQSYENKISSQTVERSVFINKFHRNKINFAPGSPYQPFSYQVERVYPSLNFYIIKVRIAHFSLTVSVLKVHQTNLLANYGGKQSNFGCIYFIKSNKEKLCVKSFAFKSHAIFQKLFPRVIKQWVIHRICSALECGPFISNAFGFDLLVFDDCIQYATEEGREMLGFSSVDADHLKQQMVLMHAFKIIHLDIKPLNTVFSPHFRKPVFIDFGFSQIIEEKVGFKTLITFKGTPNYCSPQMLAIMLQTEGYVDLYFNDAFSLEQTLSVKKKIVSVVQLEEEDSQDHSRTPLFPIFNFQYHYLQSNVIKARQTMQKCIQLDQNTIKTLLLFIKTISRFVFLRQFFEKDLEKYRHLVEYKQIQEEVKRNAIKFFYKNSTNETKNSEEEANMFEISSFAVGTELSQSYHHYLRIILQLCQLEAETAINFVSIAFQCVRFDVKNLELFQKKQIADKMNILLIFYLQVERQSFQQKQAEEIGQKEVLFLKQIKIMLQLVYYFCLSNPSPWVKKHIFDVCQQMILLSINFQNKLPQLVIYANEAYRQPKEEAMAILQYSRLITTVELVDFQQIYNFQQLLHRLNQQVTYWLSKFYQSSEHSQDRELVAIRDMLKLLQYGMMNSTKYPFVVEQANIKFIQNTEIRKYLLLFLMKKTIDHFLETMNSQQILGIVEFSKCSSDLQKLDLLSSIIVTIKILIGIHNFAGVQAYYNYIRSIVNCDTVIRRLNIHKKPINYSPDIDFLRNRMRVTLKAYKQPMRFQGIQAQVLQMFLIFQQRKLQINDQFRDNFLQLYAQYRKFSQSRINREMNLCILFQQFLNVFSYIQLQYRFFCFSDKCRDVFLLNLDKIQNDFQRMRQSKSNLPQDQLILTYLTYKMHLYRYHYYLFTQEYQKCILCLVQIQGLLQCLHLHSLLLEIIKLEITVTSNWQTLQAVSKAIYKLYNICCQTNFKSFYLIPRHLNQTYTTLVVFQYSNESLFYTFLKQLTQFLVEHPIECYFQCLLSATDQYIKFNPQRGYSLHYTKFGAQQSKGILKANPYLLIFYVYSLRNESTETQLKLYKRIILHCDRLSTYAKKKILERCLGIYLEYLSKSPRQQLFNFKMMKNYISEKKRKTMFKHSIVLNNNQLNAKNQSFRQKLKIYISFLT